MTVPPLLIPRPDDPYGLVTADKLPVTYREVTGITGNLPPTYITGNLTTLMRDTGLPIAVPNLC